MVLFHISLLCVSLHFNSIAVPHDLFIYFYFFTLQPNFIILQNYVCVIFHQPVSQLIRLFISRLCSTVGLLSLPISPFLHPVPSITRATCLPLPTPTHHVDSV